MRLLFLSSLGVFYAFFLCGCIPSSQAAMQAGVKPAPERLQVRGFLCENTYGAAFNQDYALVGQTADGRPYYRGTGTDRYLYFDKRCSDDTPNPRWLLGGKPDLDKEADLNPLDGAGCENDFGISSEGGRMPMGIQRVDWLWCGDRGSSGHKITITPVDKKTRATAKMALLDAHEMETLTQFLALPQHHFHEREMTIALIELGLTWQEGLKLLMRAKLHGQIHTK
jgi:hypothetical protein